MSDIRSLLTRPRPTDTVPVGGVPVEFRALKPADYEALSAKHTKDDGELDSDPFLAALAAACATSDDLTAEEWSTVLAENLSLGEQSVLRVRLIMLNAGAPGPGLGKG